MQRLRIPDDNEYLNEFHKRWNESCMKERERTLSMHFSHEFLKAQSQRLEEQIRKAEAEGKERRKKNQDVKRINAEDTPGIICNG